MEDYSKNLIKDYKYWLVNVFENQGYLGRYIVWCKREDALDLTDATEAEQKELITILGELREATKRVKQTGSIMPFLATVHAIYTVISYHAIHHRGHLKKQLLSMTDGVLSWEFKKPIKKKVVTTSE